MTNKPNLEMLISGFGGQGILFAGKVVAYAGLLDGREISWLPSYGPEMRGGTANCSVCVSDAMIGSPLMLTPNVLIAMNQPSLEKFENDVVPGGLILVDSSIVTKKVERDDVTVCYVPATRLAESNDIPGLANIVLIGKLLKETHFCDDELIDQAIDKCVPAKKAALGESNKKAIRLGASA